MLGLHIHVFTHLQARISSRKLLMGISDALLGFAPVGGFIRASNEAVLVKLGADTVSDLSKILDSSKSSVLLMNMFEHALPKTRTVKEMTVYVYLSALAALSHGNAFMARMLCYGFGEHFALP